MDDKNRNQKTPEANHEAPAVRSPFPSCVNGPFFFAPPYVHPPSYGPCPSSLPPGAVWNPPYYRTAENPCRYSSLEQDPREHATVYNTYSTPGPSLRPSWSSSPRASNSIPTYSLPSCPESSRAALPKTPSTPAKPNKYTPMSVREEEERTAHLADLRGLLRPDYPMLGQQPERKRSPSLISTDESDSDYVDLNSESESESSQEQERNCSPVPSCTDESDSDYSVPDTVSEPEPEPEPEVSQEQGRDPWPGVSAKMLRTMNEPEQDLYRPPIPSWNDLGPRDDNKLYGDLFGLVPASSLGPPPPSHQNPATHPQEQEKNRSLGPIDDDSLSTLSKAIDKALEKHQHEDFASAQPSLSQDLEKKMFPSPSAHDLTVHEREKDILERRRRLEKIYRQRFGYRGTVAGPSREREQMVSPSPNLGEMIRQEGDRVRELNRARRTARRTARRAAVAWRFSPYPRTRSPSPNHNDPVSQTPETSEQQSREGINAPVATASQKQEKKTPVFDDDLSEMIEQERRRREKKKSPSPDPDSELEISEKEAREETDATISKPCQEEETRTSPENDTAVELEKDLRESQGPLPASPSSSQGQKRRRSSDSDDEKSVFEHFEEMRKEVQKSAEREKKRRKNSDGRSFQELFNERFPANSDFWNIDDEALQVQSSKPIESLSDKDLGNGSFPSFDEYFPRRSEESINDVSKGNAPFAGMPPFSTMTPMPPIPPMAPIFPTMPLIAPMLSFPIIPAIPAIPNDSLFVLRPKQYPITRPTSLGLPDYMNYYAVCLATPLDHKQWRPESEVLEAVSDKPFSEWVDITGVREFIHHEISRVVPCKVTIEACRVKGEKNVRLMVFVLKQDNPGIVPIFDLAHSLSRISNRLSSMGIDDVEVEVWETDFHLQVI